jgi:hypothetical protein
MSDQIRPRPSGAVSGMPGLLLRMEGLAIAALALGLGFTQGLSWILLAVLFLAPDLAMLGYLAGNRIGSALYNAAHTLVVPLVLLAVGWWGGSDLAVSIACIWIAHIGLDRCIGYGLKYPSAFKHTHLSWQDSADQ